MSTAGAGTATTTTSAAATTVPAAMAAADSPRTLGEAVRYFFRHGSPRVLTVLVVSTLAVRVTLGSWSVWDAVVVAAIAAYWPLQEWLIHVLVLHYEPITLFGRKIDFEVPRSHRAHHRDPWNTEILFIPVQGFLSSLPLLLLLSFGLLPTTELALTMLAFYFAMTLRYEWIHFLVHTRYPPRSKHYRRLWRNHRLHHCKNEHYWYGVSMLSGDSLMRTAPAAEAVETSPTCRTLGAETTLGALTRH
jgi:hypothetical protein